MDADNLIVTNRTSTNEEREELQRQANEKQDALNKRISELEAQLESAKRERTAFLETPLPFQRPFSPFLRLPQDVIREIFAACLDPETNPTMSKKEAPTLLTQISSGLRRIALASPELWAAIHIPIIGGVPPHISDIAQSVMDKRAEGAKEWLLRRSGNLPLRVSVRRATQYEVCPRPPYVHLKNDIIDVVLSCCSRWRDVFFAISDKALLPWLAELSPEDVPLLRSFHHTNGIDDFRDQTLADSLEFWPQCRFLASPNLRRFCANLNTENVSELLLSCPITWKNLTHLGLLGTVPYYASECIALCDMLRQCPRLVSLKILVSNRGSPGMGELVFPTLKYLTIDEEKSDPQEIPGVLAVIIAPALNTLVYHGHIDYKSSPTANPENLLTMMQRTRNITHFTLGYCSPEMLVNLVAHCPLLSYLSIVQLGRSYLVGSIPGDHLLSRLFLDDDCFCPLLDHFTCSTTFAATLQTIRNIIHRKNGTVPHFAPWKALRLHIAYDIRNDDEIAKLRDEISADKRKPVDIRFSQTSQISRNLVNDIGHHVQISRHHEGTWPMRDTWPLAE
ncbi:hypothetical protein HYPSUDRAFT_42106 [Hypholoma sublateritium FD-334 SS-4]|uniref:F-box domain-containing protein n=1 Tax=Hypholoma sublateritium (strain FD-334 SS-4) TaxID=945553 RepID=A0A0D2NY85_HYPSF|nr:hypothetical protein HYPSUDRAFT_42106 [Hypholoma sublateritium FD-334 SS-4]